MRDWIARAGWAGLLGTGAGLALAGLYDAWVRMNASAFHRGTLVHVLGLLLAALASFWVAAAFRAQSKPALANSRAVKDPS